MIRKTISPQFLASAVGLSLVFALSCNSNAALIGLWNFDGNYNNDVGGGSAIDPSNDAGNNPGTFVAATIGGNPATVLDYAAAPTGSFFTVTNDAAPNGGGTGTNNYSFGFDFMVDNVAAGFTSLVQTNTFGGDVDVFVRPNGALDMSFGATESAGGLITDGVWNRVVVTRLAGGTFEVYLNGTVAMSANAFGVDDVDYRIDGTFRPFSDDSGETNDMQINSFAYWDSTLSPSEVSDLGGASAAGIPEPGSAALFGIGGLAFILRRRRAALSR